MLFLITIACVGMLSAEESLTLSVPEEILSGEEFTAELSIVPAEFSNGAVKVEFSDSLQLIETQWNLEDPSLQAYDREKNNGVFLYSDSVSFSGKIFTLRFKALREEKNAYVRVRLILRKPGGEDVLDSTVTKPVSVIVSKGGNGLKYAGIGAVLVLFIAFIIMMIRRRKR